MGAAISLLRELATVSLGLLPSYGGGQLLLIGKPGHWGGKLVVAKSQRTGRWPATSCLVCSQLLGKHGLPLPFLVSPPLAAQASAPWLSFKSSVDPRKGVLDSHIFYAKSFSSDDCVTW